MTGENQQNSAARTIPLDVPENEVLYTIKDRVATVMLNRPDRLNATNLTLPYSVSKAMLMAANDPAVRVIVITGAGRAFCAGADRQRLEAGRVGAAAPRLSAGRSGILQGDPRPARDPTSAASSWTSAAIPTSCAIGKPVIAGLNGAVAGGGMIPALCADIRLAADNMFFTTSFAQRGLIAEHGISWLLPRLVGPSRALELLMTARRARRAGGVRDGPRQQGVSARLVPRRRAGVRRQHRRDASRRARSR